MTNSCWNQSTREHLVHMCLADKRETGKPKKSKTTWWQWLRNSGTFLVSMEICQYDAEVQIIAYESTARPVYLLLELLKLLLQFHLRFLWIFWNKSAYKVLEITCTLMDGGICFWKKKRKHWKFLLIFLDESYSWGLRFMKKLSCNLM